MANFPLHKVLWRDGDIITESHFKSLEAWAENLVGAAGQKHRTFGFLRNPALQDAYNKSTNIHFHVIDESQYKESQYRIDIERMQVVNPFGQILKIDERRSFNLRIQFAKQTEEGYIMAYLVPTTVNDNNMEKIEAHEDNISEGLVLYHMPCELTTSNDKRNGVPVLRFIVQSGLVSIDETYIPYGVHLDSSTISIDAHKLFTDKYERFSALLTDYLNSLRPIPQLMLVWQATSELYRLIEGFKPYLADPTMPTYNFFKVLQEFVYRLKAELKILSIGYDQDYLSQQSADTIELLEKPLINIVEQQIDMKQAFDQSYVILDTMMKYLELLPAGPVSEKQLPVDRVEFSKVAGSNKLKIFLKEEVEFHKGETQMTIYLRSYSNAEPIHKNVRVSLGDVSQAMLKDLINALKPIPGENLSFRIECPKEIINRDRASIITIYVPTPMGEGVPDLKRYLTINVRE
jgi:hypothetical protein